MKNRRALLAVVLVSLSVFGVADAEITFHAVLDQMTTVTRVDSVKLTSPNMTFLTPGWGSHMPLDTFVFTGATSWPTSVMLYGTVNSFPANTLIPAPKPDTWYRIGLGVVYSQVEFFGETGVEESRSVVERLQRLAVSPSVVTGQMTVRLQPVGAGRPVVEIHDAVGNVIRSLSCTAGASGTATATWNRKDDFGRLVPEGVYFCRYAASGAAAVRKVLVTH
jgi:hypothetical protein